MIDGLSVLNYLKALLMFQKYFEYLEYLVFDVKQEMLEYIPLQEQQLLH